MGLDLNEGIDCLVVGGGPAGLTAMLYLLRFHRRVLLVDEEQSRALRIARARNMPGFPEGIPGAELLTRLRAQVASLRGTVLHGEVRQIMHDGHGGFIATVDEQPLAVRQVVVATGVVDNEPALPGLALLRQSGLLRHCPICDAHEHSGERILVLGDGEHAVAEARFLSHFSPQVTLVNVHRQFDSDGPLLEHGITRLPAPAQTVELRSRGGLTLQLQGGSRHTFDVLYVAMGVAPCTGLATLLGARQDAGGNLTVDAQCRTSVPRLYAVGDVTAGLDQLVVATAQGAIAATAVHNSL